jgi:hypothetical protein
MIFLSIMHLEQRSEIIRPTQLYPTPERILLRISAGDQHLVELEPVSAFFPKHERGGTILSGEQCTRLQCRSIPPRLAEISLTLRH